MNFGHRLAALREYDGLNTTNYTLLQQQDNQLFMNLTVQLPGPTAQPNKTQARTTIQQHFLKEVKRLINITVGARLKVNENYTMDENIQLMSRFTKTGKFVFDPSGSERERIREEMREGYLYDEKPRKKKVKGWLRVDGGWIKIK